jgi:general secretion pathway protein G
MTRRRAAFSLIELVIVIVIIGIVAAIAVPRMSHAAVNGKVATVSANLQTIRKAVDFFTAEHQGRTPNQDESGTATNDAEPIVQRLTEGPGKDGVIGGPYLKEIPFNPFANANTLGTGKSFASASGGYAWIYDINTDTVSNDIAIPEELWTVPGARVLLSPSELLTYNAK